MKWWLVLQFVGWWSAQQVQFQGPFDGKDQCEQTLDQLKEFRLQAKCISVAQTTPAAPK